MRSMIDRIPIYSDRTAFERAEVERTLLGSIRKTSMFVETEFLGLAQASEGFGRIRFNGSLIPKEDYKKRLAKVKADLLAAWGPSELTQLCISNLSYANDATYAQRIRDTVGLLSPGLIVRLRGHADAFIQKIVHTRNYFTHLGVEKGSAVVEEPKQSFLLNQRIHALLRCVILIDLGLSEEDIELPILHQAKKLR
jgi:hypothetical protein